MESSTALEIALLAALAAEIENALRVAFEVMFDDGRLVLFIELHSVNDYVCRKSRLTYGNAVGGNWAAAKRKFSRLKALKI
jgi:hypothetical protein